MGSMMRRNKHSPTFHSLKPGSVSHACCVCLPTPHAVVQLTGASWQRNDQPSVRDSTQEQDGSHPLVFHLLEQVPCSYSRSMGGGSAGPAQEWREHTAGSRLFSTGLCERAATSVPWQDPPHAQLWWEARKASMGGSGPLSTAGAPGVTVPKGIFLREKCRRSGPQQPGSAGAPSKAALLPPDASPSCVGFVFSSPFTQCRPGTSLCLGITNGPSFQKEERYNLAKMGLSNFLNLWFLLIFKK